MTTNPIRPARLRASLLPTEHLLERLRRHPVFTRLRRLIPPGFTHKGYTVVLGWILRAGVELTPRSHRPLFVLLHQVTARLGYDRPIRLFRKRENDKDNIGGFSDGEAVALQFSDRVLDFLQPPHLRFCLAHEIGHRLVAAPEDAVLQYHLACLNNEPTEEFLRILRRKDYAAFHWRVALYRQLQEFNADRVGLLATGDLRAALESQALIALRGGDPYGRVSIPDLVAQAEAYLSGPDPFDAEDADSTHPFLMARIRALDCFYHSEVYDSFMGGRYRRPPGDYIRQHLDEVLPLRQAGIHPDEIITPPEPVKPTHRRPKARP